MRSYPDWTPTCQHDLSSLGIDVTLVRHMDMYNSVPLQYGIPVAPLYHSPYIVLLQQYLRLRQRNNLLEVDLVEDIELTNAATAH